MSNERIINSFSGARVVEHDGIIEKTGPNVRSEIRWYEKMKRFKFNNIPEMMGLVYDPETKEDTIGMRYVENIPLSQVPVEDLFHAIDGVVFDLKNIPFGIKYPDPCTMNARIESHVMANPELFDLRETYRLKQRIIDLSPSLSALSSTSHGDMSVDNILWNVDKGIVLIDPIYEIYLYSSWLADIAKLIASIFIKKALSQLSTDETMFFGNLIELLKKEYRDNILELYTLITYQTIRTVRYRKNKEEQRIIAHLSNGLMRDLKDL